MTAYACMFELCDAAGDAVGSSVNFGECVGKELEFDDFVGCVDVGVDCPRVGLLAVVGILVGAATGGELSVGSAVASVSASSIKYRPSMKKSKSTDIGIALKTSSFWFMLAVDVPKLDDSFRPRSCWSFIISSLSTTRILPFFRLRLCAHLTINRTSPDAFRWSPYVTQ